MNFHTMTGRAGTSTTGLRRAVVALPLLVVGLSACGSAGSGASQGSGTTANTAGETSSAVSTTSADTSSSASGTPATAVRSFVTNIVNEHYTKACMSMAAPEDVSQQQKKTRCNSDEGTRMLESLNTSWAKPGVTLPPESSIKVEDVSTHGGKASVSDTAITLDGHTLREIELMGSSGDTQSFKLTLKLRKVEQAWRISDLNIDI